MNRPAVTMQIIYENMLNEMRRKFPRYQISPRRYVWWARLLDKLDKGLSKYATTCGITIAVPNDFHEWSVAQRYRLIRHEYEHMKQQKKYGLGWWPLGFLIHGFLYLLCLLAGWTMRSHFEKQAYLQTCVGFHLFLLVEGREATPAEVDGSKQMILKNFCGYRYLWMDPSKKRMTRWFWSSWERAHAIAIDELYLLNR